MAETLYFAMCSPSDVTKEHSVEQFKKFFLEPGNFAKLANPGELHHKETSKVRWNAWRGFLKVIDLSSQENLKKCLDEQRKSYTEEIEKYRAQKEQAKNDPLLDPLSNNANVHHLMCLPSSYAYTFRTLGTPSSKIMNSEQPLSKILTERISFWHIQALV